MALLLTRSLALAVLLAAPIAAAGPPPKAPAKSAAEPARARSAPAKKTAKRDPPARRAAPARSVGTPTEGRLVGGAHLAEAPHVRVVPFYGPGDARWGLESLVGLIDQAARAVRKQFPDAVLSVGHLSRPGGGDIDRHASHESGRDADIGFYVKNHVNKPVYADHFVSFKADGTAPTWPGARFDDARNWAFIASVVKNPRARISHIFVAPSIRTRLLQYARKIGAPAATRSRAAALMIQPRGSMLHDDHFHIRISCPEGSSRGANKCVELPAPRKRPSPGAVARASQERAKEAARAHGSGTPRAAAPPSGHGAARAPAPRANVSRAEEAEAQANRSESFIPSLAPMVPGLDSVFIPSPLRGMPSGDKATPTPAPAPPGPAPIDDPDGVLESP